MYKASFDKAVIAISIAIGILFLVISISLPFAASGYSSYIPVLASPVFFVVMYVLVWLYHPSAYELTPSALVIRRPINKVNIERNKIASVRSLEKEDVKGSLRTFGVGGLFGYFGKFYNSKIGKMTWYVTNMNNLVLIKMKDEKLYLISPDDKAAFIKEYGK